jgi:5-methyltetrahydropteroyltriglutamate--homocysteine methyltransferase
MITNVLGYPRIGAKRELKKACEAYWKREISEADLQAVAKQIRRANWQTQQKAGITLIPSNDFSFYDHVLDTAALVGAVPARFGWTGGNVPLDTLFAMARGPDPKTDHEPHEGCEHQPCAAMEMTKWFDTNYHYLVPEFGADQVFQLSATKPFDEFSEALALGIKTKPVLIGPVTFLLLGKTAAGRDPLTLLDRLLPVYAQVLQKLESLGAEWAQLDEPALVLDLTDRQRAVFPRVYAALRSAAPKLKLMLATYFGGLRENLSTAVNLPVAAIHFDVTRAPDELETLLDALPPAKMLSLGVVDGRNVWKNDFDRSLVWLKKAAAKRGEKSVMIAPSCSLLHSPVSLSFETKLDHQLKTWLAFAEEKLAEMVALAKIATGQDDGRALDANVRAMSTRRASPRIHRADVTDRAAHIDLLGARRRSPFAERREKQRAKLQLPAFPTTTIGSFPQTAELRQTRAKFRAGKITRDIYERFVRAEIARIVKLQEEIGLDVLVHGECERTDMVEHFAEQLEGFAFTENGWVQSYGSRCVKPPIIFGDVARLHPMTAEWTRYAQSLTKKPMKGMLTGPITMLQWSFVRDDQPRSETAGQIALAIRDEVRDLEAAGISVIQIDEPALREGLPLRRDDRPLYLAWAGHAFRLATTSVRDETQIHTHMCYCEFNDILESIAALDADVISIETSRSKMELLTAFADFKYPNEIGPGVWDIHSTRVPGADEMVGLLEKAAAVLPREHIWVNPDCGLKTRAYAEVTPSLKNLVAAAKTMRERAGKPKRKRGEKRKSEADSRGREPNES